MAVTTKYGKGYKNPSSVQLAEAVFAEGRMRCIQSGAIAIANGDSATSKIYFGKIPSNAVALAGLSTLKHGAATGVNDFDLGLEKDGATVSANCFADALDVSTAGAKDPCASIAVGDWGKRIWELLGLANDPGCEYDVVGTMNAAATAGASIALELIYSKK